MNLRRRADGVRFTAGNALGFTHPGGYRTREEAATAVIAEALR